VPVKQTTRSTAPTSRRTPTLRTPSHLAVPRAAVARLASGLGVALLAMGFAAAAGAQTAGAWRSLGPAGGLISALVAPSAGTEVAGSDAGGIWRSSDSGGSWTAGSPLDVAVPGGGTFYALAADPVEPLTMYADTGTVWKSVDGGATWSQVFRPEQAVTGLAVSPVDHLRLYALVGGTTAYRSDDGALSWSAVNAAPLGSPPDALFSGSLVVADPFDADTAFVAGFGGVLRTTDGGVHWTTTSNLAGVGGLVADPAQRGTLFAWAQGNFHLHPRNLWVTHDSGQTWTNLSIDFCCQLGGMVMVQRSGAASRLYVAGGRSLAAGGFLGQSDDGGATWSFPLVSFAMTALAVANADPRQIYVGVERAGVIRSLDGGATWATAHDGMAALQIPSVAVDPFTAGRLYVVTEPSPTNDLMASGNAGTTWARIDNFGDLEFFPLKVVVDPMQSGVLYGLGSLAAVVKSVDGGAHWQGTNAPVGTAFDLAIDPHRDGTLYTAGEKSGMDGAAGLLFPSAARSANGVAALAFDKQGHGYAANPVTNEVDVSYDGGATWVSGGALAAGAKPRALAILHPNRVYAGGDGGVFVSTDLGQTWQALAAGLPPVPVLSLAVDPRTGMIYAGTAGQGLYAFTPAP
jgi:photosystem II stability/assembly factor-like uncharacterized protein